MADDVMTDRTYAQRLRDDEDHQLALCGLLPDERDGYEQQDFETRYYDRDVFGQGWSNGGARATYPPRVAAGSTASTRWEAA